MNAAAGVARAWEGFWFSPESPVNLAAARAVFAAHALWLLLSRDLPALSALPSDFWFEVPDSARWRYLIFEGHVGLEGALQGVAIVALVGAALGLWPRICCFVAGLLLYHLAPLETLYLTVSPWSKGLTLSVLGLLTFSFSRCGDALSLRPAKADGVPASEHGWPLRLVQLFVCQAYLFAGYAKLVQSGWRWASADNMRGWLLLSNLDDQLSLFRAPGLWIAEHPLLCGLMGAIALAIDLGFVAVLFWKRSRRWLVPLTVAFHLGILVALNYAFLNLPQLLVFVDWTALRKQRPDQGDSSASGLSEPSDVPLLTPLLPRR